ncbi:MAG: metallophosphoesterase family protein [Bacilli bacterium]|nr:metallophosphoesterase family protein [Bacilli bacterium]MBQ8218850.1 metallophosphoesterase family protein [Bacilli bacterium]
MDYNKYAKKLFKKAKKARQFSNYYRILVISDLHGLLDKPYNIDPVDDYFILGDLSQNDIRILNECIPMNKTYYLYGNHDTYNQYMDCIRLHGRFNNSIVSFTGIEGSYKYKESNAPLFTHEQSIDIANSLGEADILFTHDRAYIDDSSDHAHCGLLGISEYLCKNRVPIHIHGHTHENKIETLPNGTISIGVRGIAIINISDTISVEQLFDWKP